MRRASHALAAAAMALAGMGATVVSTTPGQTQVTASADKPTQPATAAAPSAPIDRRVEPRHWRPARRAPWGRRWARSTGTHKQNRRRQLAGR